jgi:hypothetical protein
MRSSQDGKRYKDAMALQQPKVLFILYPGCATEDRISMATYKKLGVNAFPVGTVFRLGGVKWTRA